MSSKRSRSVKVRWEIEIPSGGRASRGVRRLSAGTAKEGFDDVQSIDEPPPPGSSGPQTVNARQVGNVYVICTKGLFDQDDPPDAIWVKVCDPNNLPDPLDGPPEGSVGQVLDSNAQWGVFLPLEVAVNQLGVVNTWMAWSETFGFYSELPTVDFIPVNSGHTDCEAGSSGSGSGSGTVPAAVSSAGGVREKWAGMARAWRFEIADAAGHGQKGKRCARLNGAFELRLDEEDLRQDRWSCPLPKGLLGADHWRLQYQPEDGFWYLDYVTNLDQAPGAIFCYRAHESAWNLRGSNKMVLAKDSDLCKLPREITLKSI